MAWIIQCLGNGQGLPVELRRLEKSLLGGVESAQPRHGTLQIAAGAVESLRQFQGFQIVILGLGQIAQHVGVVRRVHGRLPAVQVALRARGRRRKAQGRRQNPGRQERNQRSGRFFSGHSGLFARPCGAGGEQGRIVAECGPVFEAGRGP